MADPTLEELLNAAQDRKPITQSPESGGVLQTLLNLLMPQRPTTAQMPRFDVNGNPLPPQTAQGIFNRR